MVITLNLKNPSEVSPYFQNLHRTVISVKLPTDWIVWNWNTAKWDHVSQEDITEIREAQRVFFLEKE